MTSAFKYAGQHGAVTDDNGLIYLQTRYYNPQLMRFMNRDTVSGSITDSQSLNRFSYVQGNPLTYVDLNGQARTWLSSYDNLHGILDVIGFIPVLGNATAILSIGLDIATGNYSAIMADAVGLLPMGHILGTVGGIAIAHFASPVLTHLLTHSAILKSGLIAGGVRKAENSIKPNGLNKAISADSVNYAFENGIKYIDNDIEFVFNKTHGGALPKPRGLGPNGGKLESHHIIQDKWMKSNFGNKYSRNLAPTITIEKGVHGQTLAHNTISNRQNARRLAKKEKNIAPYSNSLSDEMNNSKEDLLSTGLSLSTVNSLMDQAQSMIDRISKWPINIKN